MLHQAAFTLELIFGLLQLTAWNIQGQVVVIPSKSQDQNYFEIDVQKISLKRHNAYLATVSGLPPTQYFHVAVKDSRCSLAKTSTFSRQWNCDYAINGGPFQSYIHGGCIGLTISNGTVIHGNDFDPNISFGVTFENEWIMGNFGPDMLKNNDSPSHYKIKEMVTGLNGWLVYNSTVAVSQANDDISSQRAPRTAIGIDRHGEKLVLLQVDGCEKCFNPFQSERGLTLNELANFLKDYTDFAVNLDGGGSSTSVFHGRVMNHPTCMDYIHYQCERPVGSAICIGPTNGSQSVKHVEIA